MAFHLALGDRSGVERVVGIGADFGEQLLLAAVLAGAGRCRRRRRFGR